MTYRFTRSNAQQAFQNAEDDTELLDLPDPPRSSLVSRNLTILGHRTSVRLEPEMWAALKDISKREGTTMHALCSLVALRKIPESSLTAAIRVFLMLYYRAATTDEAHLRVGHGSFAIMKRRARVTDAQLQGLHNLNEPFHFP